MLAGFFTIIISLIQLQPIQFERYDTRMGLSNNIIYDIYQDSGGFIWVATENGLNRFDAYRFETFHHNPDDSTSISSNIVRCIVEDTDRNLWVGTYNGLNLYDRTTGRFERFLQIPGYENERFDIQSFVADQNGNLWFGNPDHGVWRFNTKNFEFEHITKRRGLNQLGMIVDTEGKIWIQGYDGSSKILTGYDPSADRFSDYTIADDPSLFLMHIGKFSKIVWMDKKFRDLPFKKVREIPPLPEGHVPNRLLEDRTGRLWIGTETSGLFLFDPATKKLDHYMVTPKKGSLGNYVRKLYEDRWGAIWVATRNGLFRYDPHRKPFFHLNPSIFYSTYSGESAVMAVNEADDGLWLGIFSEGLHFLNSDASALQKYTLEDTPGDQARANQIWSIFRHPGQSGKLWIGTSQGLYKFDTHSQKSRQYVLPYRSFSSPVIFSIITADDYSIWAAGDEDVYRVDIQSGEILDRLKFYSYKNLSTIESLHLYKDRYLLIGTVGIGLFVYDTLSRQLAPAISDPIESARLSETSIWAIYQDQSTNIWLGTGSGLFRYDINNRQLFKMKDTQKPTEYIVYSILQDREGRLWMGTDKGLARFDPQKIKFRFYNDVPGNEEFNRRAALVSRDGRLWFGGINGLTWFYPADIQENPNVPPVHITVTQIFRKNDQRIVKLFSKQALNLSWKENTIEIRFAALNFTNPNQNRYRFQLENFDSRWVEAGDRRFARYTQLPPGHYLFRVQASNNDGVWNREGASLSIFIAPAFWQTSWFKGLIVVLICMALWSLYRYRINKLIEMERMRLRISGDLHDEIGSGLSGIALSGDLLRRQFRSDGFQSELLQRITHNARELAASLDAIVWLIDPQKDTLHDLVTKCKSTANELLEGMSIQYKIDINGEYEQRALPASFRRNLFLLFKEAVHNIARHSQAKTVKIELKVGKRLRLTIKDDGKGFDSGSITRGNGLENLRRRAVALNSALELNTAPGSGTQIELGAFCCPEKNVRFKIQEKSFLKKPIMPLSSFLPLLPPLSLS